MNARILQVEEILARRRRQVARIMFEIDAHNDVGVPIEPALPLVLARSLGDDPTFLLPGEYPVVGYRQRQSSGARFVLRLKVEAVPPRASVAVFARDMLEIEWRSELLEDCPGELVLSQGALAGLHE